MTALFVIIASILAVIGNVPYLRDIITHKIQPHPYTWLVWSIVSMVTFFGQLTKGAGVGAIPTGIAEGFTILIFCYALPHGFGQITRRDTIYLVVALLGLIPWAITKDPTLSVVTVVGIDIAAFIPTLGKTWRRPASETPGLYAMNVLRHVLTLSSLQAFNVATTLHSIVMIVMNTMTTAFILRRRLPE
jgi:hypothetical protein